MPNRLISSLSPYLLQHANNPVDWYPWGEEALKKAAAENKLIIVSIGYAACHWCHVMEHESFEDNDVAEIMNKNFVCIKVDREERPDIDNVYMQAAMLINGNGGWPLNAIALPDGKPIYAGTYFPKQNWIQFLLHFSNLFKVENQKIINQANHLANGILSLESIPFKAPIDNLWSKETIDKIADNLLSNIDYNYGGFNHSPKFMMPVAFEFLWEYYCKTKKNEAKDAVFITLQNIACGGIHDHIEGGIARYSTDIYWKAPHFEKMLYDNAQLLSLYAKTSINDMDVQVKMLDWLETSMKNDANSYYSAFDADSEKIEGKYYCWTYQELENIFTPNNITPIEKSIFYKKYNVLVEGNWEHQMNILHTEISDKELAGIFNLEITEIIKSINKCLNILKPYRLKKIKPALDDKTIVSWNAQLIIGFLDFCLHNTSTESVQVTMNDALTLADFIVTKASKTDGGLYRIYKNNSSCIDGFLTEYAFSAKAFIKLYQNTFDEKYLFQAYEWTKYVIAHFYDEKSGMFFFTSDEGEQLFAKNTEVSDNVIPSSNAVMAEVLYDLGYYFNKTIFIEMADTMLNNLSEEILKHSAYHAYWAKLALYKTYPIIEVIITGDESISKAFELLHLFKDFKIYITPKTLTTKTPITIDKPSSTETVFYVCHNKTCLNPILDFGIALNTIIGLSTKHN